MRKKKLPDQKRWWHMGEEISEERAWEIHLNTEVNDYNLDKHIENEKNLSKSHFENKKNLSKSQQPPMKKKALKKRVKALEKRVKALEAQTSFNSRQIADLWEYILKEFLSNEDF